MSFDVIWSLIQHFLAFYETQKLIYTKLSSQQQISETLEWVFSPDFIH